ncbi:Predicted nucleic acid-binding protein, contains PIN domain [Acetitomaculum ruminis DSM 5522]|uniref:Predicted nucleic acid-binding protein, contains PIN domain n=1 Tax=Acetitomaculum ruminis DSM 5522 TaxID=1120918 RepID=A0A1I0YK87_9FIRM|nr:PIN domain-containing protein [Acetitomaculum ruminis]SFB13602.1 Predicted nucleic acid-binding protein, contains PIN domain [Acetitomaculum ruminis DSM 5522]
MKLLIDANIILDVLQKREPHYKYSAIIWKLCESKKAMGYVSILTFMNIVYILRKELSPEKIDSIYKELSLIFNFEDLTHEDVKNALTLNLKDFEDAIQIQTASKVGVDFIITRNVKDFVKSPIPAYTPIELIQRL